VRATPGQRGRIVVTATSAGLRPATTEIVAAP